MKEKTIIYLHHYIGEECLNKRQNNDFFSFAGNKKIHYINDALNLKYNVINISPAYTNRGVYHKKSVEKSHGFEVIYTSYIRIPIISFLNTLINMLLLIRTTIKMNRNVSIIFYNIEGKFAIPALIAKKIWGINIILEYEDSYVPQGKVKILKDVLNNFLCRVVHKNISGVILVNSLLTQKFKGIKSCVIRGFYNKEINELINYSDNNNYVVYSGRLDDIRGVDLFVDAIGILSNINKSFKAIITGYGPLKSKIEDIAKNSNGLIEYKLLNDYEYNSLIANAKILVNPQKRESYFSLNSFPSKLFDYVSGKGIVISSDISDVKKFFGDYIVFYKEDNAEVLAKKIDSSLKNEKIKNSNTVKLRHDFIRSNCTNEYYVNQLVYLLE